MILTVTGQLMAEIGKINGSGLGNGIRILWFAILVLLVIIIEQVWNMFKSKGDKDSYIKLLRSYIESYENNAINLTAHNDWLITEMHHRVKNNLQILSSLINSQLSFIEHKEARDALFNSSHRLYALSLVHQKLVQNSVDPTVEISCCIKDLIDYLTDEFHSDGRVNFELDLVPLRAEVSFAIPFVLIINELLTNTLKFAFPENRKGKVKITLRSKDNGDHQLVYADDGVGLPDHIDLRSAGSFGRSLIIGLSQQIKAQITINNDSGLEILMNFKAPEEKRNHFAVYE